MRLVILSYSHHGRGIGQTIRALGHDIVGVMDGEEGPRQQLAEIFQCPALPRRASASTPRSPMRP